MRKQPSVHKRQPSVSIWERIPMGVYILLFSLVILGVGIGLPTYLSQLHHPPPSADSLGLASATETDLVGKQAPGFSLKDPYGQTYTLNPGDRRNHVLVFYMGYF